MKRTMLALAVVVTVGAMACSPSPIPPTPTWEPTATSVPAYTPTLTAEQEEAETDRLLGLTDTHWATRDAVVEEMRAIRNFCREYSDGRPGFVSDAIDDVENLFQRAHYVYTQTAFNVEDQRKYVKQLANAADAARAKLSAVKRGCGV